MPTIFIAGSGGHLAQLDRLAPRIGEAKHDVWISDRTPQSESILAGRQHIFVKHSAPREVLRVIANAIPIAREILRAKKHGAVRLVSTGAGVALSATIAAYITRSQMVYIESATRVTTLSLTGRVINRAPRVTRRVQYPHLANERWKYEGSVFDSFRVKDNGGRSRDALRVFVTVGVNQHIGYESLIESVLRVVPPDWEVFVQSGPTDMRSFDVDHAPVLRQDQMAERILEADVVVSHAGTGSALAVLDAGKVPVLVPRDHSAGEHVDDHQTQLANFLAIRGFAVVSDPASLTADIIRKAASLRVLAGAAVEGFRL